MPDKCETEERIVPLRPVVGGMAAIGAEALEWFAPGMHFAVQILAPVTVCTIGFVLSRT